MGVFGGVLQLNQLWVNLGHIAFLIISVGRGYHYVNRYNMTHRRWRLNVKVGESQ